MFLIISFSLTNCSKPTTIFKGFDCQSTVNIKDLETVLDANNNFSLDIPKYWKTELYFDNSSSIFTTADTTKQLTKTYLIKASLISGKLDLNKETIQKIKESIEASNSESILSVKDGLFDNKQALLIQSKSNKETYKKSVLHLYMPISFKHYFEIEIHCYGTEKVEERFCEAIDHINSLKITEL